MREGTGSRLVGLLALSLSLLCFSQGAQATDASAPKKPKKTVTVVVTLSTKGNDVSFDQNSIQVPFGVTLKLIFKNAASPDSEIEHNVAILRQGTEAEMLKLISAEPLEVVQKSDMILVKTRVLKPGEKDTLTFEANQRGFFTYLCLVAGHGNVLGMKGTLNVR